MNRERDSRPGGQTEADAGGSVSLLRVLLGASAIVLVLFGIYEIVERTWLSEADPDLLNLLQRVRAIAAAMVTAGVAAWLLLRDGPPLLAAGPLPGDGGGAVRLDPAQQRLHYARWFIVMRWIAIGVTTVAVIVAVDVAALLPRQVGPSLGAITAWLALLNLGYSVYLRFLGASPAFLAVQVYADLVVLILLLHFSGGIENPLTPLLLLHVIIAGITLGRTQAYMVAGAASALFGVMAWGEYAGFLPHYTLTVYPHIDVDNLLLHAAHDTLYVASHVGLQALILLLVAYFTTTLVERIRTNEKQLGALADGALAQTQMLERALDTTGTALCLCDRELRPYWSNSRWAEWAQDIPELGCNVGSDASAACDTLQDGHVHSAEIRPPENGMSPGRVLHLTTAPLHDRGGEISHVVALARDVTAQHQAQARVVRAERLAAVGELAGQVAHEVNNPIAIISAKARLLLRHGPEALPARAAQEVVKIAELADRVARIAQGLLSYCRPAPGARIATDISMPVRRALTYIEARAADAGVTITDELPDRLPAVHANAAELEQVFLNLFLNALDALPDGGMLRVSASMGSAPDGGLLTVRVADTGSGIPPDIRPRVFEPFLTSKGGQGSGLGLSICQGIVRSHGGDIEIEDGPTVGTVVVVTLPRAEGGPAGGIRAAQWTKGAGTDA
jgi:signal transduction histidine kinase